MVRVPRPAPSLPRPSSPPALVLPLLPAHRSLERQETLQWLKRPRGEGGYLPATAPSQLPPTGGEAVHSSEADGRGSAALLLTVSCSDPAWPVVEN